jgi:hypothetical protein
MAMATTQTKETAMATELRLTIPATESKDKMFISFEFDGRSYTLPSYRNSFGDAAVVSVTVERYKKYLQIMSVNYTTGPGAYCGQLMDLTTGSL